MIIKIIAFDIDGTLTDGKLYIGETGEFFKAFDVKDGCGIHDLMPSAGIVPAIITARKSEIVAVRCRELGIEEIYQGYRDKTVAIHDLARKYHLPMQEGKYLGIAYMGDDILDIPAMRLCGVSACPVNSAGQVVPVADFVSQKNGGNGAARDFIEWVIEKNEAYK